MSKLEIEITSKTPGIVFDLDKGVLKIFGRSLPENSTEFYQPLFDAIEKYKRNPQKETRVELYFEYFNTSSSRIILDLVRSISWIQQRGLTDVNLFWHYERDDWDMEDAGKEYQQILTDIKFELKEVEKFAHRA